MWIVFHVFVNFRIGGCIISSDKRDVGLKKSEENEIRINDVNNLLTFNPPFTAASTTPFRAIVIL